VNSLKLGSQEGGRAIAQNCLAERELLRPRGTDAVGHALQTPEKTSSGLEPTVTLPSSLNDFKCKESVLRGKQRGGSDRGCPRKVHVVAGYGELTFWRRNYFFNFSTHCM